MPLPFLTADSACDAQDPDSPDPRDHALPYEDADRWRRPYRPGPLRVAIGAVLLLISSFMLLATMIIAFAGAWAAAAVCLVAALTVIGGTLRLLASGVRVNGTGLRRTTVLSTRTIPWQDLAELRTAQQPVRWMGLPRTVQGQALVLKVRGGGEPLVLLTDHNTDFLSRPEAFDRAAEAVQGWADDHQVVPIAS
ncbi:PH domain-containing protein [Streptomyces antimicrobicus]|uniref:PH domain-containing protein n=1 Tax=Streptomyces antimicrobicus TaxID=2883108 RepID=A0ABS8BCD3_9ACTN|nr:PH domain-containing protein [Streptomyces antimicrobicus]MCB5182300.1 PH domain-containing protein [Streptomyces antimicrobicus]